MTAFPAGAPFTATFTYDPGRVSTSYSTSVYDMYDYGFPCYTTMSVQTAGHTISTDLNSVL